MINSNDPDLTIKQQCEMADVPRSSYYEHIKTCAVKDKNLKEKIEVIYSENPVYGSRRIREILVRQGENINRKKVQRLMKEMNIAGICPKKKKWKGTKKPHMKYPFIARDKPIVRISQVWSTDITYLHTAFGTVYLVAVIDWFSRFVLSWEMSNSMDESFCIAALRSALGQDIPYIFNTDQGSQFTGENFIALLLNHDIKPSMCGKGRATDNAQCERLWRTIKWEDVYLTEPQSYQDLRTDLQKYLQFYNHERPHQSIDYKTPSEVHFDLDKKIFDSKGKPIYTEKESALMSL
jgi:putative transposase